MPLRCCVTKCAGENSVSGYRSVAQGATPHAEHDSARLGMNMVDGMLVAQAPDCMEDETLRAFRSGLLAKVHACAPRGVAIDVSRVRLLDSSSYALLADAGRMVALLGARVVFVGFQPGVVAALMDLDVDADDLVTAMGMEDALELLRPAAPVPAGESEEGEPPQQDGVQGLMEPSSAEPESAAP